LRKNSEIKQKIKLAQWPECPKGNSSLVSSTRKSEPKGSDFFCFQRIYRVFCAKKVDSRKPDSVFTLILPLFFPLRRNALDEFFHAIRAVPAHLFRDVTVNVERKSCRGMTQIALHRLDVVSGFDGGNSVGVP
jgi:hypothetical protein